MDTLYNSFSSALKKRYGKKVWKVPVDAGFTCPNRDGKKGEGGCIYCDNSSFVMVTGDDIRSQVENRIQKLKKRGIDSFIIYFQSYTNTYGSVEQISEKIESALFDDGVVALHIGTRPDEIDSERAEYLSSIKKRGVDVTVELGLQSGNDKTLELINRGHSAKDFVDAVEICHKYQIEVCAHIILGLPDETKEDMLDTVRLAVSVGVESVKFHHLHVVKGTKLADMYEQGLADVLSEEKYIEILSRCISILPKEVVIARLVGDAPDDMLLAPMWPETKSGFISKLENYMRSEGFFQGKNYITEDE